MPWFDPVATPADVSHWLFRPGGRHKIARWPKTGTARTDVRYRMPHSFQFDPTALQWLVHIHIDDPISDPGLPVIDQWGFCDLLWDEFNDDLTSFDMLKDGPWEVVVNVKNFDADGLGPDRVRLQLHVLHEDEPFRGAEIDWIFHNTGNAFKRSIATDVDPNDGFSVFGIMPTDYATIVAECFSISECYMFPRVGGGPVGGFAEIQLDQWISYPPFWNPGTTPFRAEWTIRPRNIDDLPVMTLSNFQSFFSGHTGLTNCRWWQKIFNFLDPMILNEWHDIVLEWGWSDLPNGYTWWKNGIQQGSRVESLQNAPFDRNGWRDGQKTGDFDLRDLKIWTGSIGSPVVYVDLPLQDDACDLGLLLRKGTTHNMALPSCP